MIKEISSSSPAHITVSTSHSVPFIQNYGAACGTLRYNSGSLEVYDGSTWHILSSSAYLNIGRDTIQAIEWAKQKMYEEKEIERLAEEYPLVQDLKDQLDVAIALVKNRESKLS